MAKSDYSIIREVEGFLGHPQKPDSLIVGDATWLEARPEVKDLLIAVENMRNEMAEVEISATQAWDWHLAYQSQALWVGAPFLHNLDPILYRKEVIRRETQNNYIHRVKEWLRKIKELCSISTSHNISCAPLIYTWGLLFSYTL